MSHRVTILGAGNGGHALSFHLSQNGADVCLWEHPDFSKNLDGIRQNGGIEAVKDFLHGDIKINAKLSGFAKIHTLTTDIKEALSFSTDIIMIVPSYAQETIFNLLAPYLTDEHLITILPGNFASLMFTRLLSESKNTASIKFAEGNTIPHACRIVGPGKVFILGYKDEIEVAAFPGNETSKLISRLESILPLQLKPLKNVLAAGFSNMNMVAHPATATLSAGVFESGKGEFFFYKQGMSDSVSKVQQAIDDEHREIGKQFGLKLESFVDIVNLMYHLKCESIRDFALHTPVHNSFGHDAPKSPHDRYISEDTPYLLVPMHEFGCLAKVAHPAIESIIHIDNILNDVNYFETGRTLEKMGLSGLSIKEIIHFVDNGNSK